MEPDALRPSVDSCLALEPIVSGIDRRLAEVKSLFATTHAALAARPNLRALQELESELSAICTCSA